MPNYDRVYKAANLPKEFFRNAVGLFIFIPMLFKQGLDFIKTDKLWMHTWRSIVGLAAMYGFFYAIANLKLSNAMVFSYSSPIFIPLIAWLFLKEKIITALEEIIVEYIPESLSSLKKKNISIIDIN